MWTSVGTTWNLKVLHIIWSSFQFLLSEQVRLNLSIFFCTLCLELSRSCVVYLLHQMNESDTTYTHSTSWIHFVRNSTNHFRHIKGLSTTGRYTSALFMDLERTMCNHLLMGAAGGAVLPILDLRYPLVVWLFFSWLVSFCSGCTYTYTMKTVSQMFSCFGSSCQ